MEKVNTLEKFVVKASNIYNNKYNYSLTHYKGNKTAVIVTCPVHGNFNTTPNRHLAKHGCYTCGREETGKKVTLTTDEFITKATRIHAKTYDYSKVSYVKSTKHVTIGCYLHGNFKQKPLRHLQGRGCPSCASLKRNNFTLSKGEIIIKEFLNKYNVLFEAQKQFEGCVYKKLLSFDFYLPKHNLLIEFDGTQHHSKNSKFHTKTDSFSTYQKRDKIKSEYANTNKIKLLRIPYKAYKIKEYIHKVLSGTLKINL